VAEANLGEIVAKLKVDTADWQRGLQQAQQQLAQFQAALTQQAQQGGVTAAQLLRAQSQAATQAAREQLQASRQAFQEEQQAARLASNERIAAARAASQAEILEFRRATEAAKQAFREQQEAARVAARQAAAEARQTGGGLSGVLQVAGGIGLATTVGGMTSALARFASETVTVGARMEQLRASLSALAGSSSAGQAQFDSLFATAQRLGIAFEPLVRGWRTLTAAATQAGLPLADQRRLLEAVAREGQLVGASNEELSRAFQALGQMASKNVVSLEELRGQLGEALPRAMSAMATGMGRTTEELLKLIEAGGVTFPAAARALTRGLEEVGRQGTQTGNTLQSAFNRFGNELLRVQDELTKSVGPLMRLTSLAANFLKVIGDAAQAQRQLAEAREEESRIGTGVRARDIARLPPAQQARLRELPGLIAEQQEAQQDPSFLARFGPNRAARIAELQAEHAALIAQAQALKESGLEQERATAATNKARATQEQQRGAIEAVTKQLDALTKAQAEFRAKAALAPETFGRPGTAEFLKGQEQALRPGVEKLTQSLITLPEGVALPPELLARAKEFDTQIGNIGRSVDALKEKQAAARKAESEAAAEAKRLAREAAADAERAIGLEITLTQQLAQVKASMLRTEQSAPERAAERARTQGASDLRTIDAALKQFADSPALRERAPQMRQEFEQLKAALPGQTEVAALQAFNNAMEKDVLEPLRKLAGQHTQTKDDLDLVTAKTYEAAAANTAYAQEATSLRVALEKSIAIEQQLPELRRQAAESAKAFETATAFQNRLDAAEARLQAPREQREEVKFRMEARAHGIELTPAQEQQMKGLTRLRQEQERLQTAIEIWRDLSQGVGSAWVNALSSIAEGTQTVSQAFTAMGKSIMKTMADIAAQQAFQAIFRLGVGLLTGALAPTVTPGAAAGGDYGGIGQGYTQAAIPYGYGEFQHGGVIRAPTMAMLGEGPSSTLPEYVLNRNQMDQVMNRSSNGSGSNVTIMNYPSKEQAQESAARERAAGREVILNEVLGDLRKGSGSSIGRMFRQSQT
jgi:tape measure domain-containing protein